MADIVKLIYKGDEMAQGGGGSGISDLTVVDVDQSSGTITRNNPQSLTYTVTKPGFIRFTVTSILSPELGGDAVQYRVSGTAKYFEMSWVGSPRVGDSSTYTAGDNISYDRTYAVGPGTFTLTGSIRDGATDVSSASSMTLEQYAYFS